MQLEKVYSAKIWALTETVCRVNKTLLKLLVYYINKDRIFIDSIMIILVHKFSFDAFIASGLQIYLIFVFETTFKGEGSSTERSKTFYTSKY